MFCILIGSVSRLDYEINSDIDICRIECDSEIPRNTSWPLGPISYIDYDIETFFNLYDSGSLFLYHILNEGILLEGNKSKWDELRNNFELKKDFTDEIVETIEILDIFNNVEAFGYSYLSFYANLFVHVKNLSIFYLADHGQYIFNKKRSIRTIFSDEKYLELLFSSFNYMKRGVGSIPNYDYCSKELASETLTYYMNIVRRIK